MGSGIPKQYLKLGTRTVLEHSLDALSTVDAIAGICVALAPGDRWWGGLGIAAGGRVLAADGGAERCDSVLNALIALAGAGAHDDDWVLVHDAARPCVRAADVERLIDAVLGDDVGGLLAVPVRDTMKQARQDDRVARTIDRSALWHAFTPQMFRLGSLREALSAARAIGAVVTDEASAMELTGHAPLLVEGHTDNIKVTRPEDLALATFFLEQQGRL